jgi:hypothetical protein
MAAKKSKEKIKATVIFCKSGKGTCLSPLTRFDILGGMNFNIPVWACRNCGNLYVNLPVTVMDKSETIFITLGKYEGLSIAHLESSIVPFQIGDKTKAITAPVHSAENYEITIANTRPRTVIDVKYDELSATWLVQFNGSKEYFNAERFKLA